MSSTFLTFRKSLGLTQADISRLLNMTPSLVAKIEMLQTNPSLRSEASRNFSVAESIFYNLPDLPPEPKAETDAAFVQSQIDALKRTLQIRTTELEKFTSNYQTGRLKRAFVAAMRASDEFQRRDIATILNKLEIDGQIGEEDNPPSSRRKLELVIESVNEQIAFWENKLPNPK
jgi:transcriptional regulator with XRE-family HTH domain